jgi:hypothetical protein
MRIEYLENTSNGNVIHLFDFSNDEIMEIKKLIDQLAQGEIDSVAMHEHALVDSTDNVHLTLQLGEDEGVHFDERSKQFICVLTPDSYENMSELIVSFAEHSLEMEGFEWLDETSDISLLISPSQEWE